VSSVDISVPHGGTIRILALARGLKTNGFDVRIVAPKPSKGDYPLDTSSLEIRHVRIGASLSMLNQIARLLSLARAARKCQHEGFVLQMETSPLGGVASYLGCSEYVLVVHDLSSAKRRYASESPLQGLYQSFVSRLERRAVLRASRVVTVSDRLKEFLVNEWKVPGEKIVVVPNGYFESKAERYRGSLQRKGLVTFVGLLAEFIDFDKILQAAEEIDGGPRFVLIGDGPLRSQLEEDIKRRRLTNVEITGFLPVDQVYKLVAESEVVLFPFRKSFHTDVSCPIKLIEYAALGKAIVVDDVTEIASLLAKDEAAVVVDPTNQSEFISAIKKLLSDPILRDTLGAKSRMTVSSYSWEKNSKRLTEMYRSLLS
jgi:glycosyltransferase involved in cell wall biosynthesis